MDNLTFYLPEFMPKLTETSKKNPIFGKKKMQKIQVFGKKIQKFQNFRNKLQKFQNFWNKLQKSQDFG